MRNYINIFILVAHECKPDIYIGSMCYKYAANCLYLFSEVNRYRETVNNSPIQNVYYYDITINQFDSKKRYKI